MTLVTRRICGPTHPLRPQLQNELAILRTDVDRFFKRMSQKDVHNLFGNILGTIVRDIIKKQVGGGKMGFLVDNTEIPYYGNLRTDYEIGTRHSHLGTRKYRMIQGHALHGSGLTLFSGFHPIKYKQYRSKYIGVEAEWAKDSEPKFHML